MKTKKWISLLLACALVVSLFAGCAKDTPDDTVDNSEKPSQPTVQQQGDNNVDADSAADVETAQRSVFNYAISNDCVDFDPFTYSGQGADQMFVGLYQPFAHMDNGEMYSSVIKEWSYSDDKLTMYVELYDYITDSAGNKIKASDVVFSYNKSEELARLGTGGWVDSFTATGDYTIEIKFPQVLGVGRLDKLVKFYIVSEKAYNEGDMHTAPVGTGPYVLADYTSGYEYTFEKRADYWQTDESLIHPRDMATVDTINYYYIAEAAQRTIALKNGSVDAAMGISTEDRAFFENSDDFWVYTYGADISYTVAPNCDPSRPTGDVNLRRAIFYAISSEVILESVFGGSGNVNFDWCPSWAVGLNPDWANETDNYYTFSQEKAKEYLAQSSYKGEELIFLMQNNPAFTSIAEVVVSMLNEVGIKVKLNVLEATIAKEERTNVDAWDLYLDMSAVNTYWIDGVNGFLTTDKTTWDGSQNFWYEQDVQDMLKEYMQPENATTENFEILRDYVIDNALGMSLINPTDFVILPKWCTGVTMSIKKCIVPGGNTYEAE